MLKKYKNMKKIYIFKISRKNNIKILKKLFNKYIKKIFYKNIKKVCKNIL